MGPRRPIRLPARSVARRLRALRAVRAVRALRALLFGALMTCLLGGDCHWAFSSNTSDNHHHDDGGTTVVVTDLTMGDGGPDPVGAAGLDPALLELGECLIEFAGPEAIAADRAAGGTATAPLFQRAVPLPPALAMKGVSPARIWPPERIGETELAAFAQALLAANEEVLHLPIGAAALQYLDLQVTDGVATVRFGPRAGMPITPVLAVRFGSGGELFEIERLPAAMEPGDRIADPR